jgi:methyl-accepting chemotaxis protein
MNVLQRFRIRTKLAFVMLLASLALIASVVLASSIMRSRMMADRLGELRAVAQTAVGITQALEEQVAAHQISREQALDQLRKAAHAIRFDGGAGYIVAQTLDSEIVVHGANPALEGTRSTAKLPDGRPLTDMIKAALASTSEGSVSYLFAKPGSKDLQPKTGYVVRYAPWNLVFNVGAYTDDIDASFRTTLSTLGLLSGGILLVTLLACWMVSRDISGSMTRLKGDMQSLAVGDLTVGVSGTDRADEVGEMATTVQVFKDNAIEMERLKAAQKAAEQRTAAEKHATMQHLASDFEAGVGEVVKTVSSAATEMESTAASLSGTANRTSERVTAVAAASEQATANVQSVASATEELASSVAEISRQVAISSTIAAKAASDAEHTNALVTTLADAAKQIGAVTDMINEIASRTNLLALNATIEAARAGDAGKGFAVVASEVKSLASQTAKATQEISSQIAAMQSATTETVAAIQGIGATIGQLNEIATTISSAVEEQGAATQEIARNVQQAAAGTAEVSSNIAGITLGVSATGAAADEMLRAAGELSKQGETLRGDVEHFLGAVRAA